MTHAFAARRHPGLACLLVATLLLATCADEPTLPMGHGGDLIGDAPAFAALLTCAVDVEAGAMECEPSSPSGAVGGPNMNLIVGSQHRFVRMGNFTPNRTASIWYTSVTVQNLTLQPFGTQDGTAADPRGVRVFFVDEPSNGVEIANHDGEAEFTGSGKQKYFEYTGGDLGEDGILSPGETSMSRQWWFAHNGATEFRFSVLIWTTVPDPDGYSTNLTQVSAGELHTCGVSSDGKAYCWGKGQEGQLGSGTVLYHTVPTPVHMPPGVKFTAISAGTTSTCADGDDGNVWCWGNVALGNASVTESDTPVQVAAPAAVELSGVVAGSDHACARGDDGNAWCWGANDLGQLGDSTFTARTVPTRVAAPAGVAFTRLAAGGVYTCADGDDGNVYCWGGNGSGQLGDSTFSTRAVPAPVRAPTGVRLSRVTVGASHTCAQGDDGGLYCWGANVQGQLGNGAGGGLADREILPTAVNGPPDVELAKPSAGYYHTCAVGSDGNAYCWGRNMEAQLGDGTTTDHLTPVRVDAPPGTVFESIEAGGYHTCGRSTAGETYCWGANSWSPVGDGTTTGPKLRPVVVAGTRTR